MEGRVKDVEYIKHVVMVLFFFALSKKGLSRLLYKIKISN